MMIPVQEKDGEVDIKSAFIKGIPNLAVKVASGFFQNPQLGLPSQSGLMLVVSAETGFLKAVLLDNGYLTQVRTGAAGAVAAKYLAPEIVENVGVIGTGEQARFQMEALYLVRPFKTIRIYSRYNEEAKNAYIDEMSKRLGVNVIKCNSVAEVVKKSSVVVTTTPSREGFITKEMLHPGLHITAMGSDTEEKQELDPAILGLADRLFCDLHSQCERLGELRSGYESGSISPTTPVTELGAIINKTEVGRSNDDQITICDLTGVGVQDTMIAVKLYDLAEEQDLGIKI
jgi:ornithine cyclodeaminase